MASIDEIWLADFGEPYPNEPASLRPALVLGPPDIFGSDFPIAIVAPLTTTHRGLDLHVEIAPSARTGLHETSYVQCELLRSVNANRLIRRVGAVDIEIGWQVSEIVRTLLNHP
jgi:mRNA interferase MazF